MKQNKEPESLLENFSINSSLNFFLKKNSYVTSGAQ